MPAIFSVFVSLIVFSVAGKPLPHIHDEFAHLLAADTFAHGRLTNPTPLDLPSFETMHELMQPTYMSKFGPAQGLMLAIGQALFDQPSVGLILTTALACAAVAWCLRAFFPPRWALAGGLLAAVHPEIIIWDHEYWGGNVGLIGGALALGGLVRLDTAIRTRSSTASSQSKHFERISAALLALGLAILANSRPYEAAVWGIFSSIWLAVRLSQHRENLLQRVARFILAGAVILVPVGTWMGYYNWRITGHATELPYTEHVKQYMAVPLFFWQSPQPPKTYNNPQFTDHYDDYEFHYFTEQRSFRGWLRRAGYKVYDYVEVHLLRNMLLSLGLIALIASRFSLDVKPLDPRIRLALFAVGTFVIAYAIIPWFEEHYTGASLALLFAIGIYGVRLLRVWTLKAKRTASGFPIAGTEGAAPEQNASGKRAPIGQAMVRFAACSCVLVLAFVIYRERRNQTYGMQLARASIEDDFKRRGGKHLVIVHYEPNHFTGSEWVFNKADLNSADVIWARDISPEADSNVIRDYGGGRQIWILYPDGAVPILHGYSE